MQKNKSEKPKKPMRSEGELERKKHLLEFAGILIWIGFIIFVFSQRDKITAEAIVNYSPSNPALAALGLALLSALKSLTFVFYSGVIFAANGMMFPYPVAVLMNLIDAAIIVTVPYLLYGRYAEMILDRLHDKYPHLRKIQYVRKKSDFLFALLIRNIKALNIDLGSSYMGGIKLRYLQYLAGSIVAILPEIFTFPLMIKHVDNPLSSSFIVPLAFNVACTVAALLIMMHVIRKSKS